MSERLLESRISALRGQVRRLLVLHGLSWLIAGVVPAGASGGAGRLALSSRRLRPYGPPGREWSRWPCG